MEMPVLFYSGVAFLVVVILLVLVMVAACFYWLWRGNQKE